MKCLAIKWKELTRTAPAVVVRHLWNFGSCVAVKGVVLISCVCCRLVCLFLRDQWVMLSCCTNCGHLLCWWTCCVEWNVWSDVTDSYHPDACAQTGERHLSMSTLQWRPSWPTNRRETFIYLYLTMEAFMTHKQERDIYLCLPYNGGLHDPQTGERNLSIYTSWWRAS